MEFDRQLETYAQLLVDVALGLQPGDRLLIKATTDAMTLTRLVVNEAYRVGAKNVDVIWMDDDVRRARFTHGSQDAWEGLPFDIDVQTKVAERGESFLYVYSDDPDLFSDIETERVARFQRAYGKALGTFWDIQDGGGMPWSVAGAPTDAWARRVFPDLDEGEAVDRLWQAVFAACRVNDTDPVRAWQSHLRSLGARREALTAMQLSSMKYSGPQTDLTVGLIPDHRWLMVAQDRPDGKGSFVANFPTEEVFVAPHRARVDGVIRASRPFSFFGSVVEDAEIEFEAGVVVGAKASRGQDVLDGILETGEGARRLGELALVPNESPVASQGLVWHNVLFDENQASHIALGDGFGNSLAGHRDMTDEQVLDAGVNQSEIHVDIVVGSDQLDIVGITVDGREIPLIVGGDWAFEP